MTPREVVLPPVSIEPEALARNLMAPPKPRPPYKVIAHRADHPLKIGDIKIPCFVLENEERVLSQRAVVGAVALSRSHLHDKGGGSETASFEPPEWLKPFVQADLVMALRSPILFKAPGSGAVVYGYPARLLSDLCLAIMEAQRHGATTSRQAGIVERTSVLLGGFATVGIVALVDEATGYQRIRDEHALAKILKTYLSDELQPWTRTFPFEFYELLYELRGWGKPRVDGKHGNQVARDTVDLVYTRINKGIYEELQRRTPRLPTGELKYHLHRWFTPHHGHPRLAQHIEGVMALMRAAVRGSGSWQEFKSNLNRAYPKFRDPRQFDLDLEQKPQRLIPGV